MYVVLLTKKLLLFLSGLYCNFHAKAKTMFSSPDRTNSVYIKAYDGSSSACSSIKQHTQPLLTFAQSFAFRILVPHKFAATFNFLSFFEAFAFELKKCI